MIYNISALHQQCKAATNLSSGIHLMDESPRWLLQKGRAEEAKAVLTKAVKLNNTKLILPLTESIDKMIQASVSDHPAAGSTGEKPSPAGSMFRGAKKYLADPAMRRILLATAGIWFIHDTLYLGVALSAHNFSSDDPFLYVALTGVMDAMAILVVTPLSTRLGRKVLVWLGFAVGGSFFLVELLIPEDLQWARWIFIMGGFFLIAGTQQVNYMYAPELFPTESRARGFAFVQLIGSIGTMCVPLITDVVSHYAWWASGVVFGCAGILGSFLVFFLPETKDRPLPETLQDVNSRWRREFRRASRGSANTAFVMDVETAKIS
ncbi:solute carrier family 22 member 6-like [Penaeus japonicus]|uniref:solute carrier family 22 member 6-like n=1 Tax=Penaeus japonicus TaxID=27405 RepID=UPI001C70C386|nr:solute carrier family 22 member 6-like [Penaeus japonicus]